MIKASEMPVNADGSVYHLNLQPQELAHKIILVGDPGRVPMISAHLDTIEVRKQNREIVVHTGTYHGKRISILSTGMGTDNIDIVINELDALVNIDLQQRTVKPEHTTLELVRLGTCGGLHPDMEVNSFIASRYSLGMDGLIHYYQHSSDIHEYDIENAFLQAVQWKPEFPRPYAIACNSDMFRRMAYDMPQGITLTASGFYAPQCRVLRHELGMDNFCEQLQNVSCGNMHFTNMEMETSALYGLSRIMGHKALTICVVIANRATKTFSRDYHPAMEQLVQTALERI
ncbi:MAG: nucleoside phosphorylase [Bacteroidales bacterium]|nr:nucleoside phosphorylase [Bacteroidales bacterium]